jgi:glutamine synthetase
MTDAERHEAGAKPLPRSLDEALGLFSDSQAAREWFGEELFGCYLRFKRAELRAVEGLSPADICAKYAEIY